jgi:hypothetical protein
LINRVVECDKDCVCASSLAGASTASRIHEHLSHRARSDPLEMQAIGQFESRRGGQLQPRLVDQCRGAHRRGRIVSTDARRQPPELLVRDAEYVIQQPSVDWNGVERLSVVFVGHIQCDADTASPSPTDVRMTDPFSPVL